MIKLERVLVIEAHPDDATISAGGTIARIRRENPDAQIILTYQCPCLEDPFNDGNLNEHLKNCEILGINRILADDLPRDGYLETHKQEIRNFLHSLKINFNPQLVLCPSIHEFHQDHKTVAECALTIFRDASTILGYEVLRSVNPDFKPNFYVILEQVDVDKKIAGVNCWKSQLKRRPYFFSTDIFMAHMRMRGAMAKTKYAEAFELMWGRV
jgi:LmbE family N-acetylglucosaminyl deacetylase